MLRILDKSLDLSRKALHYPFYIRKMEAILLRPFITAGWAAAAPFPFSLERVFKDIPKPSAEHVLLTANEVVGSGAQDEVLQTPVASVTTGALSPLYDLTKQDVHGLDKISKQRYRDICRSSQVPSKCHLPNVSFFRTKIDSYTRRTMKPKFANHPSRWP